MEEDTYLTGIEVDENGIEHIGIKRRSGRYPWGSGQDPYQRSRLFKSYMDEMRAQGMTHAQIAKTLTEYANMNKKPGEKDIKISSTDVRAGTSISGEYISAQNQAQAYRLKEKGLSNVAIAKQMGTNESTVRGWLKVSQDIKETSNRGVANTLKEHLETKPFLDVGKGTELYMGISDTRLRSAIAMLRDEGYRLHYMKVRQLGTDKETRLKILTKPGVESKAVYDAMRRGEIYPVTTHSDDGGLTFNSPKPLPVSVNSKSLQVRYGPEGGKDMDGVIELRRNVPELSLGDKNYAQVRMAVDGTHYLKGMAIYADDLPPGVNIRFNTNKTREQAPGKLDALKPLNRIKETGEVDNAFPFGATVRPKTYIDKKGNEQTSPLNIVNEAGDWDNWSKSLSSQMLSKQPLSLATQQLRITQQRTRQDLADINALTNPVVRHKLLEEFADSADAAAVHLKAASFPRQSSHVILPINSMRPNEIYARNFDDGDKVVLVRYPHGGPFEIPALTVNNRNATAKKVLGGAIDAVGIHHSVAEQLSGADFDGDSVLVILNNEGRVRTRSPLKELEGFDPKSAYPIPKGDTTIPRMSKKNTQTEMGKISNLITDMTIHKAPDSEIARAVKHSMVVIDAEKHGLNYKQSERDQGINELKARYQKRPGEPTKRGASTLISRASSEAKVPERLPISGKGGIDPITGEKLYKTTDRTYVDKHGKTVTSMTKGTQMGFAKDARELSSGTPMEELYASHANAMKSLANQARLDSLSVTMPKQSKAARAYYAKEVESLTLKLREAQRNAPLERRAQILGNAMARARIDANPEYDSDHQKKIRYQSLEEARIATGANKKKIGAVDEHGNTTLTDREWEAIQAGAFSSTTLRSILSNSNMDRVKELATPRRTTYLTPGQVARAKQLAAQGRGMTEIAETLGLPRSTVIDNINRG